MSMLKNHKLHQFLHEYPIISKDKVIININKYYSVLFELHQRGIGIF